MQCIKVATIVARRLYSESEVCIHIRNPFDIVMGVTGGYFQWVVLHERTAEAG